MTKRNFLGLWYFYFHSFGQLGFTQAKNKVFFNFDHDDLRLDECNSRFVSDSSQDILRMQKGGRSQAGSQSHSLKRSFQK